MTALEQINTPFFWLGERVRTPYFGIKMYIRRIFFEKGVMILGLSLCPDYNGRAARGEELAFYPASQITKIADPDADEVVPDAVFYDQHKKLCFGIINGGASCGL